MGRSGGGLVVPGKVGGGGLSFDDSLSSEPDPNERWGNVENIFLY